MSRISWAVCITLLPAAAWAGGFSVSEQDAVATGRGGTAVASAPGPSAVHYNPASLTLLRGPAAAVGLSAVMPQVNVVDPATQLASHNRFGMKTPPHVYGAWAVGKVGLGLGFNAPFGGGVDFSEDWRGRYELVGMNLQVLGLHFAAAYAVTDEWSFGATVNGYSASILIDRRLDFVSGDARALLSGSGIGVGATLGATWSPAQLGPFKRAGLAVRLPASVPLKGRADFEDVPDAFAYTAFDQAITSQLTLPAKIALGTEWQLGESTRLHGEAELTFWSSFKSLDVNFESDATPDAASPRNWWNAPTFRLGVEHDVWGLTARAGALFDFATSPSDTLSPSSPDSNRVGGTLGVGKAFGGFRADGAYMLVAFLPRTSSGEAFPASYSALGHVFAMTLSYRR